MSGLKKINYTADESQEMKFFMNADKSDVTFIVEDRKIPANKWLLSMKSDVFDAMFSDNFRESKDKRIEIEDIRYEVFKAMLLFLYSHKLVLNEENNYLMAMDVFRCADKYHLKPLMNSAEKKLIKMIGLDNMEDIYEFARSYDLHKLCYALNAFIKENLNHYMSKSLDDLKRISTLSDSYLMGLLLQERDEEIDRLEKIISDVARSCVTCKDRITFSAI